MVKSNDACAPEAIVSLNSRSCGDRFSTYTGYARGMFDTRKVSGAAANSPPGRVFGRIDILIARSGIHGTTASRSRSVVTLTTAGCRAVSDYRRVGPQPGRRWIGSGQEDIPRVGPHTRKTGAGSVFWLTPVAVVSLQLVPTCTYGTRGIR